VTAVSSVDLEDEVRAVLGYGHGQAR